MDKESVLNIISCFKESIESQHIKVNRLILFGSYSKGTSHEDSDIDLVVISDDFKTKDYWKRIDILSEAIYEIFKPIDAVAMTPEEWQKKESHIVDYAQDGEVVYSA